MIIESVFGNNAYMRVFDVAATKGDVMSLYAFDYQDTIVGVYNTKYGSLEQTADYYPYGLPHADPNFIRGNNRRLYSAKELTTEAALNTYDFAARSLPATFPIFSQPDPLAERYTHLSPHSFCAGDPINLIDPTGCIVTILKEDLAAIIVYTLTPEEAEYIEFNNGVLNTDRLNECQSTSENFIALKTLANSDIEYSFDIGDTFVSKDDDGNLKTSSFKSDKSDGCIGVTYTPGHPESPSIDKNVHIVTSSFLSEEDTVKNIAHEGYVHGYLYVNQTIKNYNNHRNTKR